MKAVLIGTDLMYRQDGKLVPIEINTNVGWDPFNRLENDIWQLDDLADFIREHQIRFVVLEGIVSKATEALREKLQDTEVVLLPEVYDNLNLREDTDDSLLIRSSYSEEAIIDSFCRDKIAFMDSLQGTEIASEYILKTADGLQGEITGINDYGEKIPNFIVKYRYPNYNSGEYPKLYKFDSLEALHDFAENDLEVDYFIMPFFYNEDELYNGERMKVVRNWSLFVANEGGLDSIVIANYTKVCGKLDDSAEFEENGELKSEYRKNFLTAVWDFVQQPDEILADEDDLVWMADGTWKEVKDLEVGDVIKSVEIPTVSGVDVNQHVGEYGINFEELQTGAQYATASVTFIQKRETVVDKRIITFEDETSWYDTAESSYPTLNENGIVEFKTLDSLEVGDEVLLINFESSDEDVVFSVKTVAAIEAVREPGEGYYLTSDNTHLFVTRDPDSEVGYVAVEHNATTRTCNSYTFYTTTDCTNTPTGYATAIQQPPSPGAACTKSYWTSEDPCIAEMVGYTIVSESHNCLANMNMCTDMLSAKENRYTYTGETPVPTGSMTGSGQIWVPAPTTPLDQVSCSPAGQCTSSYKSICTSGYNRSVVIKNGSGSHNTAVNSVYILDVQNGVEYRWSTPSMQAIQPGASRTLNYKMCYPDTLDSASNLYHSTRMGFYVPGIVPEIRIKFMSMGDSAPVSFTKVFTNVGGTPSLECVYGLDTGSVSNPKEYAPTEVVFPNVYSSSNGYTWNFDGL